MVRITIPIEWNPTERVDGSTVTCVDCGKRGKGFNVLDRHTRLKPLYICSGCEHVRNKWKREQPAVQMKLFQ